MKNHLHLITLFLCMASLSPNVHGEGGIETDGTVGPKQSLSGAVIDIPQTFGATVGNNLFHSFGSFNVNQGQTVTFQENTTNTLDNVISRVTGGMVSDINGSLVSTPGGHANFYLVNPAGVMFGSSASINVAGDFHVSTADELRFKDGAVYSATNPNSSTLTAEAPAAFGFSAASQANNSLLQVDGAALTVNPGKTIDMVGGKINVGNGASLTAEGGEIRLVSRQGAGEVSLERNANGHLPLPDAAPSAATAGDITMRDSTVVTTGDGGGRIAMWGGNISVTGIGNSKENIYAGNKGTQSAGPEGGVDIRGQSILLDNAWVSVGTTGKGNAGNIMVAAAGNLDVTNKTLLIDSTTTKDSGKSGAVTLTAGNNLTLEQRSAITQATLGKGVAGDIVIHADGDVLLQSEANISTVSFDFSQVGSVSVSAGHNLSVIDGANILGRVYGSENAGAVNLTANGDVTLKSGGRVSTETLDTGQAGTVVVDAGGNVDIDGQTNGFTSGFLPSAISSSTLIQSTGNAGTVQIQASGSVTVQNGGIIATDAAGLGNAGEVSINARGDVAILGGGTVSSSTYAQGRGGNVNVGGSNVRLDHGSISAKAGESSTGLTGQVALTAQNTLALDRASTLSVENLGRAADLGVTNAGGLKVSARTIALSGGSQITTQSTGNAPANPISIGFKDQLRLADSTISTSAYDGDGGAITIRGAGLIGLRNADITTSVTGDTNGNGGDIALTGDVLMLQSGAITADTTARTQGGDITLNLRGIVADGDNLILGGNQLISAKPGIPGWNVIRAAAPDGVEGLIQSTTPQLNLSGTLLSLGGMQFQTSGLGETSCVRNSGSTLTRKGHGASTRTGEDLLHY